MTRVLTLLADLVDATLSFAEHLASRPDRFSRAGPMLPNGDPAARYLGRHPFDH